MINIYKSMEQAKALGFENIQSLFIFYYVACSDGDVYAADIANELTILNINIDTIRRYLKKMIAVDLLIPKKQGNKIRVSLSEKGKEYFKTMEKNPQKTERTKPEKNPQTDEEMEILRMRKSMMTNFYMFAMAGKKDSELFKENFNKMVDLHCTFGHQKILFDLLVDVFDESKLSN